MAARPGTSSGRPGQLRDVGRVCCISPRLKGSRTRDSRQVVDIADRVLSALHRELDIEAVRLEPRSQRQRSVSPSNPGGQVPFELD